jgi:hypothetical protein
VARSEYKTGSFHAQGEVAGTASRNPWIRGDYDERGGRAWLLADGGRPKKKCSRVLIIDDNVDAADSLRDLFLLTHAKVEVA